VADKLNLTSMTPDQIRALDVVLGMYPEVAGTIVHAIRRADWKAQTTVKDWPELQDEFPFHQISILADRFVVARHEPVTFVPAEPGPIDWTKPVPGWNLCKACGGVNDPSLRGSFGCQQCGAMMQGPPAPEPERDLSWKHKGSDQILSDIQDTAQTVVAETKGQPSPDVMNMAMDPIVAWLDERPGKHLVTEVHTALGGNHQGFFARLAKLLHVGAVEIGPAEGDEKNFYVWSDLGPVPCNKDPMLEDLMMTALDKAPDNRLGTKALAEQVGLEPQTRRFRVALGELIAADKVAKVAEKDPATKRVIKWVVAKKTT
jgi:hypothetical protein